MSVVYFVFVECPAQNFGISACQTPFLSPSEQCQSTEGNSEHWPQPGKVSWWLRPFNVHHWTVREGALVRLRRLSNAFILLYLHFNSRFPDEPWFVGSCWIFFLNLFRKRTLRITGTGFTCQMSFLTASQQCHVTEGSSFLLSIQVSCDSLHRDLCRRQWMTSGLLSISRKCPSLQCWLKLPRTTESDVLLIGRRPSDKLWTFDNSQYLIIIDVVNRQMMAILTAVYFCLFHRLVG